MSKKPLKRRRLTSGEREELRELTMMRRRIREIYAELSAGNVERLASLVEDLHRLIDADVDGMLARQPSNHGFHAAINKIRSENRGERHLTAVK